MHCNVVNIHKQFYIYTETSDLWASLLQFQSAASISDLFSCPRTTDSHASVVRVVLYNVHTVYYTASHSLNVVHRCIRNQFMTKTEVALNCIGVVERILGKREESHKKIAVKIQRLGRQLVEDFSVVHFFKTYK